MGEQINRALPCNEENFAFLAVLSSNEIKIKDSIAALIGRQRCCEIVVGFLRAAKFVYHHLLVLNLENNEPVVPLCF